ncbi:MAG: tetratricopeptide repeat protein [Sandaracinaceae bacterium]
MDQLSAHLDRGWDLVARGDLAGAGLSAEKAVELAEDSPDAHNLLGYVLSAQGRVEPALEHYHAALELDDGFVDAMLNIAELSLFALRDPDAALKMVREARECLRSDELDERADAILLEVEIHLDRGDREAARKTAQDLPSGPFENAQLRLSVGRALVDVGEHDRAEPLLQDALTQGGLQNGDAHYYLGIIHDARGDDRAALLSFLRSREMDLASARHPWALPQEHFEQRVQTALGRLSPEVARALEGALVVVTDLPGAEIVAEGVDPRAPLLLDGLPPPGSDAPPSVRRVFVYRRNVERVAIGLLDVDVEVARTLDEELRAAFPELSAPTAPAPEDPAN